MKKISKIILGLVSIGVFLYFLESDDFSVYLSIAVIALCVYFQFEIKQLKNEIKMLRDKIENRDIK